MKYVDSNITFTDITDQGINFGEMMCGNLYHTEPNDNTKLLPITPYFNIIDINFNGASLPSLPNTYLSTAWEFISLLDGVNSTRIRTQERIDEALPNDYFSPINTELQSQINNINAAAYNDINDMINTFNTQLSSLNTQLQTRIDDLNERLVELEDMPDESELRMLSLRLIKKHLIIDLAFTEDDGYLIHLGIQAEQMVERHLDDTLTGIRDRFGGEIPRPIIHAALLLVGSMYMNRESEEPQTFTSIPHNYEYLLATYKNRKGFAS